MISQILKPATGLSSNDIELEINFIQADYYRLQ